MNKINYIKGDILNTKRKLIAHSCNNMGKFGAGVALTIARFIPQARFAYLREFREAGFKLGDCQIVKLDNPYKNIKYVCNIIGQQTFGRSGIHADAEAIAKGVESLILFCESYKIDGFATVKMGSGYGGLSWEVVERKILPIISKHYVEVDVHYI